MELPKDEPCLKHDDRLRWYQWQRIFTLADWYIGHLPREQARREIQAYNRLIELTYSAMKRKGLWQGMD